MSVTVTIGGTAATNVAVVNATTITATTPAHAAGSATITVTVGSQSANLTNGFTYAAPPTVTANVSPVSGALAGGTAVTITGTGFAAGATVTFGAAAATNVVVVSATSITCTTPAGSAGAVTVTVTNSNGLSGNRASAFTYAAVPTVTAINPNTGTTAGGTSVTITGTNFYAGATVSIGGTAATNVVVASTTSITATTPAHAAGAATVTVTVSGQSGSFTNGYTYAVTVQGVYGGYGAQGATASPTTLSGTTVTLSNGVVLNQLQTTAEQVGDSWLFTGMADQCIYLLLTNGSRIFIDDNTSFTFVVNPAITVTVSGATMYLYATKYTLYDGGKGYKPKVAG